MIMNLFPVLKEILEALEQLVTFNKPHFIYTNKMPFSKEDIQILSRVFAPAELEMQDNSTNNRVTVHNTQFPGVWVSTLWGRTVELTPILEILEVNWYPHTMGFPPEDFLQGLAEFEAAVASIPQMNHSVKQAIATGVTIAREKQQEVRLPLRADFKDLSHYLLVPGSLFLKSPEMTIQATQFWGVWVSTHASGEQELIVSPFPEAFIAPAADVKSGIERLQHNYLQLQLTYPIQGVSS